MAMDCECLVIPTWMTERMSKQMTRYSQGMAFKGTDYKKGGLIAHSRETIAYRSCPLVPSSSLQVLGILPVRAFVAVLLHSLTPCRHRRRLCVCTTVLPPASLILKLQRHISRLFAKSGYNVALISRNSDSLHKFAAELKTGETDVSARMRSAIRIILFTPPIISFLFTGSRVPNNRLQLSRGPRRFPRSACTLAARRHSRRALQCRLRCLEALPADYGGRNRPCGGHEHQSRIRILA